MLEDADELEEPREPEPKERRKTDVIEEASDVEDEEEATDG